ncbi:MAG: TolB family protein [Planctomycetota bacterium]|jgi:Tol biopolymer transport system component
MSYRPLALLLLSSITITACRNPDDASGEGVTPVVPAEPLSINAGKPVPDLPGERFLRNVRQLTFGGENAEAYWSGDGTKLILQSKHKLPADQIFILDLRTGERTLVSTGKGVTTCSYFMQDQRRIIYASTHLADAKPPPPVMMVRDDEGRRAYVWPLHTGYDIFTADLDGNNIRRVTKAPGYDAEATVCPVTGRVVFTSVRDGDMEVYSMEPDGSGIKRLTNRVGYDGGPFYSHDGSKIVLRSSFPAEGREKQRYQSFLKRNLMVPTKLEITAMNRDGSNFHKVTTNGKANFAPFWHPDNKRIIFASNQDSTNPRMPNFELYLINEDGTNQVRVTHNPSFDSFPMFSPDGKYLAFASNRFNPKDRPRDTNIFVAEWVE